MKFWNAIKMIAIRLFSITIVPLAVGAALWGIAYLLEVTGQFTMEYIELAWTFVKTNWKAMAVVMIIISIALVVSDTIASSWKNHQSHKYSK